MASSHAPTRASGFTLPPVRGRPEADTEAAEPAVVAAVPLDAAVTVSEALTVRAAPLVPTPDSSMVCAPAPAAAGMLKVPVTVPAASGVRVPRVIGSECNTNVTVEHGFVVEVDDVEDAVVVEVVELVVVELVEVDDDGVVEEVDDAGHGCHPVDVMLTDPPIATVPADRVTPLGAVVEVDDVEPVVEVEVGGRVVDVDELEDDVEVGLVVDVDEVDELGVTVVEVDEVDEVDDVELDDVDEVLEVLEVLEVNDDELEEEELDEEDELLLEDDEEDDDELLDEEVEDGAE